MSDAAAREQPRDEPDSDQLPQVQRALLAWWDAGHRDLPWRRTRDPYAVLVSELMLQQTQVERVTPKWLAFMARFPSPAAVAAAPVAEVIRAWAGLGYNRRAVNLHRLCRVVVEEFDGRLPGSVAELEQLPGVGPYTARAVAAIAFDQPEAAVDTNVRRVLTRVIDGERSPRPAAALQALAQAVLPAHRSGDWNQTLMELGARVCTTRDPRCGLCPVAVWCASAPQIRQLREQGGAYLPVASAKPQGRFSGSPRFYRGRVVDLLRVDGSDEGLLPDEVGRRLRMDYDPSHHPWLGDLLAGLARDGLVEWEGSGTRVRLPR